MSEHRVRAAVEHVVEPQQVAREHEDRVPELAVGRGIAGVALIALRHQVHHHQPALRHGEIEIGRLTDEGRVHRADRLDGTLHRGVPRLLAVAEDDEQPPSGRAAALGYVPRGPEHRRHRRLGIAGAAAVEAGTFDAGREWVASPALARGHHVEMRDERQRGTTAAPAHFHRHGKIVAAHGESPLVRHRLDEDGDLLLVPAHRRDRDQFLQQGDLIPQDPPPGTSPSPFGPRSSSRTPRR